MSRKKKHQYKSEAEYQASEQLHKFKIKFEYEPFKIEYEWREDKKYIPDFVLPNGVILEVKVSCLLYTSPSPRDGLLSRMPSSA